MEQLLKEYNMQRYAGTILSDTSNQYLRSVFNPKIGYGEIPDLDMTTSISKSVEWSFDFTSQGNGGMILITPHSKGYIISRYVESTYIDFPEPRYFFREFILPDQDISDDFEYDREVSGCWEIQSATTSGTLFNVSGILNAAGVQDLPPIGDISFANVLSYARNSSDSERGIPVDEGVSVIAHPTGSAGFEPRLTNSVYNGHTITYFEVDTSSLVVGNNYIYFDSATGYPANMRGHMDLALQIFSDTTLALQVEPFYLSADADDITIDRHYLEPCAVQTFTANVHTTYAENHYYLPQSYDGIRVTVSTALPISTKISIKTYNLYTNRENGPGYLITYKGVSAGQQMVIRGIQNYEAVPNYNLSKNIQTRYNHRLENPFNMELTELAVLEAVEKWNFSFVMTSTNYEAWLRGGAINHVTNPVKLLEGAGFGDFIKSLVKVGAPLVSTAAPMLLGPGTGGMVGALASGLNSALNGAGVYKQARGSGANYKRKRKTRAGTVYGSAIQKDNKNEVISPLARMDLPPEEPFDFYSAYNNFATYGGLNPLSELPTQHPGGTEFEYFYEPFELDDQVMETRPDTSNPFQLRGALTDNPVFQDVMAIVLRDMSTPDIIQEFAVSEEVMELLDNVLKAGQAWSGNPVKLNNLKSNLIHQSSTGQCENAYMINIARGIGVLEVMGSEQTPEGVSLPVHTGISRPAPVTVVWSPDPLTSQYNVVNYNIGNDEGELLYTVQGSTIEKNVLASACISHHVSGRPQGYLHIGSNGLNLAGPSYGLAICMAMSGNMSDCFYSGCILPNGELVTPSQLDIKTRYINSLKENQAMYIPPLIFPYDSSEDQLLQELDAIYPNEAALGLLVYQDGVPPNAISVFGLGAAVNCGRVTLSWRRGNLMPQKTVYLYNPTIEQEAPTAKYRYEGHEEIPVSLGERGMRYISVDEIRNFDYERTFPMLNARSIGHPTMETIDRYLATNNYQKLANSINAWEQALSKNKKKSALWDTAQNRMLTEQEIMSVPYETYYERFIANMGGNNPAKYQKWYDEGAYVRFAGLYKQLNQPRRSKAKYTPSYAEIHRVSPSAEAFFNVANRNVGEPMTSSQDIEARARFEAERLELERRQAELEAEEERLREAELAEQERKIQASMGSTRSRRRGGF